MEQLVAGRKLPCRWSLVLESNAESDTSTILTLT
eukprot:gene13804-15875_t